MARFTAAKGLEAKVAQMIAPAVTELARVAADAAKDAAPLNKKWVRDPTKRNRPEHLEADGQLRPENLRFTLHSPEFDMRKYGVGPIQMGPEPRVHDKTGRNGFTSGLTEDCYCQKPPPLTAEGAIGTRIQAHPAQVAGASVSAAVTCEHPLCVNAEFGNDIDRGAFYMKAGLKAARRRLHS